MMDFDRKSGSSDGKARNGRDPLMELMRLFGSRPEEETPDHEKAVQETPAEFPSGEFPALGVAYPSQSHLDDYRPFAAGESAGAEGSYFPGTVVGDEISGDGDGYDVRLTEDDIRDSAYYGVEYGGGSAVSGQEPFFAEHPVQNISVMEEHSANMMADHQHGGVYTSGDAVDEWDTDLYSAGNEERSPAAQAAGYQEEPFWTESSGWGDQDPGASVSHAVGYEGGTEEAATWEGDYSGNVVFSSTDEDLYNFQPQSDPHFRGEGESGNADVAGYSGGQGYGDSPATGYPLNAAEGRGRRDRQESVSGSQAFSAATIGKSGIDTNDIFNDGFFSEDMLQETALEPSDYENPFHGPEVYQEHALSENADEPAWDGAVFATGTEKNGYSSGDENIVAFSRQAPGYQAPGFYAAAPSGDTTVCRRDNARPQQIYYGQVGQGYSYVVQPVVQNSDGIHAGNFTDRDAAVQNDTAVPEDYSAENANASVSYDEEYNNQTQYHDVTVKPHDFDMTDRSGQMKKGRQVRDFGAAGLDETGIEATEPFDLPPVDDYGDEAARLRIENALDQEFSDIFETDAQPSYATSGRQALQNEEDELFPIPEYDSEMRDDLPPEQELADEEEQESGVYDWASPAALAAAAPLRYGKDYRSGRRKWFYRSLALIAFVAAASGAYMFYSAGDVNENDITVIRAEGDGKVKPETAKQELTSGSDQAVYNSVEGNPSTEVEQETLIDRTETPVDIHKMDEQPPASTESGLDQSSVENLVRQAAAHSVPIHIVPTVLVSSDRKVMTVSQPDQRPVVLIPGGSMDAGSAASLPADAMKAVVQQEDGASATVPDVQKAANEIREPRPVIAEGGVPAARQLADSVEGVTPPAVIPEKPILPVQVALNTGKRMLPEQQDTSLQVRSTFDDNDGAMALNDFYVQISSQPSKEAAEQSVRDAKQRFGSIIGSNDVVIVPAVIPNRGTYYRVRVPIGDYNAAVRICEQYKQAGGNCFIGR